MADATGNKNQSTAIRYDRAFPLSAPVVTDDGFLRLDGFLTRSGIFAYQLGDGSIRRELRPESEVFNADSTDSLKLAPLTLNHPPAQLSPHTAKKYTVGSIGTDAERIDSKLRASIMVTDASAISSVESGSHRQLSCGYRCDIEPTSGEINGQRFDAIQRNIKYNHVALVTKGRAGPDVSIRMDADGGFEIDETTGGSVMSETTVNVRIDGIDFDADPKLVQALDKQNDRQDAELLELQQRADAITAERDQMQARLDAANEQLEQEQKARKDAEDPDRLRTMMQQRLDLERKAGKVLDAETKLDEMSDRDIMIAVIKADAEDFDPADRSDDYIVARFDAALEFASKRNDSLGNARQAADDASASGTEEKADSEAAREKYLEDQHKRWQRPLATSSNTEN